MSRKLLTNQVLISIIFFLVVSFLILFITHRYIGYNKIFLENILGEAHGMLIEIFLIGIVLLFFIKRAEKRIEIKRYKNIIDDFRYWKSEESIFRIIGNIKRLNENKITKIDLSFCYLKNGILNDLNLKKSSLIFADLEGSSLNFINLKNADLAKANLTNTGLYGVNLHESILFNSNLFEADLRKANLSNSLLVNANLENIRIDNDTDFSNAVYNNKTKFPDWFNEEKKKKFKMIERNDKLKWITLELYLATINGMDKSSLPESYKLKNSEGM